MKHKYKLGTGYRYLLIVVLRSENVFMGKYFKAPDLAFILLLKFTWGAETNKSIFL